MDDARSEARRPVRDGERQRGRRMLGLLNATLAQAREPRRAGERPAPGPPPSAAQQEALEAERRAHDAERASIRHMSARVHELTDKLAAYEAAHRTARASKRRLSSFLVTHTQLSTPPEPREADEVVATAAARSVPHVPLCGGDRLYEVYYLPRKLLPVQEEALDAQEEHVDAEIDRADDDWDRVREAMQTELQRTKQALERHHVAW